MNRSQPRGFNRGNFGNNSFGGRTSYGSKPQFRPRFNRPIKRLDPSLFVKKAKVQVIEPVSVSEAKFSEYAIIDHLKRNIADRGYLHPTPIQEKAIPEILAGRDVIGIANTGTGKTGAFLISFIDKVFKDKNQKVLIVVPTRELATQIGDEFRIFAKGTGLSIVTTVGGMNIRRQMYELRNRPNFVVGTPGRLKDLIGQRELNLGHFQNVVLDEVDRMVDMGFINDVKYLVSLLPKPRQSLFFSATVDEKTKDVLRTFVSDPVMVSVKQQNTAENIDQDIVRVGGGKLKLDVLCDLLAKPEFDKVIIFGRTKWGMERLAQNLRDRGFKASAIHGNKSQNQRQRALDDFKNGNLHILIGTDVASRGLDIENVTHVINYDAPETYDDYVHRIGRTGRAGKKGVALTFVD
ncbi:DEAD/DEAH box helicase [Candidatus Roizmanbacteria bacterium]|nr:MAG: DEAD/DEAH box helicase [Candidatus Roizmanbacteria bacterium]